MVVETKAASHERPLPIYAIFGSDDFLRTQAMREVVRGIIGDDRDSMAYVEFDGRSAPSAEVLDECRTPSLLAPVRVVCVRDADGFVTVNRAALEKYLLSPSPTGSLILVCDKWDARWKIYKLAAQIGRNIPCHPPKRRADLAAWITRRANQAHRCRLDSAAAYRLIDLVGDQLGLLNTELAKLATFVAPQTAIRLADIESLVGASRAEKVFGITDAIARRDASGALALWDQVLATDRDAPYRAVGGLAFGFRKLLDAKRLVAQGLTVAESAQRANIWTDPPSLKRQLDRFSLRQWQDHLVQLLRIDMGAKTGLGTVRSSVEKLIVQLCAAS
ncbi:MAG: DNA polymerase III subunit delta [Phycisphaerae bacterium]|nr:DNA polymerase III subunit delta [Phycisphaerae bacterium]